jgi:hypothetical protein
MVGSLDGGRARPRFHAQITQTTRTTQDPSTANSGRTASGGSRATAARAAEPPLRLTRRGRAVLIAFTASALLVLFWLTAGPGAQAGDDDGGPGHGKAPATVVVGPGETLWEIAERHDPDRDPRITVQRIADLNGLPDSAVHPGQQLRLPSK